MRDIRKLAILGAKPSFRRWPGLEAWLFPTLAEYEALFRDVFQRQYYTNHGPLAQQLERQLEAQLQISHAICVTNEFIGLVLAAHALSVQARVVVAAYAPACTAHSLTWTDAKPLLCDVDAESGMMTAALVGPLLARFSVSAILGANFWGDTCDATGLRALADENGIPLYFDSTRSFGGKIAGKTTGGMGELEVVAMMGESNLGAACGAAVCTNDDRLAARVRTIRSSYGVGQPVPVAKTGNGRLSEAQAAIALFLLERYPEHQVHNQALFERLSDGLGDIPGLEIRHPTHVSDSDYQTLVFRVNDDFGITRDELLRLLHTENVGARRPFNSAGSHIAANSYLTSRATFPAGARYFSRIVELPIGPCVSEADIENVCEILYLVHRRAEALRPLLSARP